MVAQRRLRGVAYGDGQAVCADGAFLWMSTGKARYANPAAGAILNDRKKICLPQEANLFVEHPVFLFCFIAQHSAFHVVVQVVVFPIVQSYKFKSKSQRLTPLGERIKRCFR